MMTSAWRVVEGEVRAPFEEAEWWGASLAVLIAKTHHPKLLADQYPETDAVEVAHEVLGKLQELRAVADAADAQPETLELRRQYRSVTVHREGGDVVFSPGCEIANFAWCLMVFATAVVEPHSREATIARGATAYAASAWSNDIGRASGALQANGRPSAR
jgi:hypothetical protein